MKTKYTKNLTKIYDSYLMQDVPKEVKQIIAERIKRGFPVNRTLKSYIAETKTHNRLYRLGLFKKHTKDTDLEEFQSVWLKIIYFVIGV